MSEDQDTYGDEFECVTESDGDSIQESSPTPSESEPSSDGEYTKAAVFAAISGVAYVVEATLCSLVPRRRRRAAAEEASYLLSFE